MTDRPPVTTNGMAPDPDDGGRFAKVSDPLAPEGITNYMHNSAPAGPTGPPPSTPPPSTSAKPRTSTVKSQPGGIPVVPIASVSTAGAAAAVGVASIFLGPAALAAVPVAAVGAAAAAGSRSVRTKGRSGSGRGVGTLARSRSGSGGATVRRGTLPGSGGKGGRRAAAGSAVKSAGRKALAVQAARRKAVSDRKAAGPTRTRHAQVLGRAQRKIERKKEAAQARATKRQAREAAKASPATKRTSRATSTARPTTAKKSTVAPRGGAGSRGRSRGLGSMLGGGKRGTGRSGGGFLTGGSRGKANTRPGGGTRPGSKGRGRQTLSTTCGTTDDTRGPFAIINDRAKAKKDARDKKVADARDRLMKSQTQYTKYRETADGLIALKKDLTKRLRLPMTAAKREELEGELDRVTQEMRTLHAKTYGTIPDDKDLWKPNQSADIPTGPLRNLKFIKDLSMDDHTKITTEPTTNTGGNLMNPFNLLPEALDLLAKVKSAPLGGAYEAVRAIDQAPDAVRAQQAAFRAFAKRAADGMPLYPEAAAALAAVDRSFSVAVQAVEVLPSLVRTLHEADIARFEAARTAEQSWDVAQNGGPVSGDGGRGQAWAMLAESEDMHQKILSAELGGMMDVVTAYDDLGRAVSAMAETFATLANRASDEMPFHKDVIAAIEAVWNAYKAAVDAAEAVGPIVRQLHDHDIKRHEDPRNGEDRWDLGSN